MTTDPVTPAAVETEIMRLSGLLDLATSETAKRAREAAEARVKAKVAYAQAFLTAEGPVEARKASATIQSQDAQLAAEIADARLLGSQDAARNMRAQLDALRSVNANVRHLAAL
jgi:hypothetical protein